MNIKKEDNGILFVVEDNGKGMDEGKLAALRRSMTEPEYRQGSIGIVNVYDRMRLLYSDNCHMEIESAEGKGTKVSVRIPYTET